MKQMTRDFCKVLDAFAEELPIWAETVNEEPISTQVLVERVAKKLGRHLASNPPKSLVVGLVLSLQRFVHLLGLLNREALSGGQVQALSYDAYNAILAVLELLKTEDSGLWFAKEGDHGPSKLRKFLRKVENNRLRHRLGSRVHAIRRVHFAVAVARAWTEGCNTAVTLLYRRERSPLGQEINYRWELPGGMLSYSDIHEHIELRTKRELVREPTPELLQKCLAGHLYGKLGLIRDDYDLIPADEGSPIIKTEQSETYVVLTEYVFHPFLLSLNQLPRTLNVASGQTGWFPLDAIIGVSHWSDSTAIKNTSREIVRTVLNKVEQVNASSDVPVALSVRVPISQVRGLQDNPRSVVRTRKLYYDVLARRIELTVSSSQDLIIFENDAPPEPIQEGELSHRRLEEFKDKFDILAYDAGGLVASRHSKKKDSRVSMRTGNSGRFYALQLLLLQVGRSISYDDLVKVVYGLKQPHRMIPPDEVPGTAGKLLGALREKFKGILDYREMGSFLDTESRTGTVIVGRNLRTCLIVEQAALERMAPLVRRD